MICGGFFNSYVWFPWCVSLVFRYVPFMAVFELVFGGLSYLWLIGGDSVVDMGWISGG